MKDYLNRSFDFNSPNLTAVYDELPLWSSYFGAVLLEKVRFKKEAVILDIGCGAGFPLIELAQRFGDKSKVYGIDPWKAALERIKQKQNIIGINNITLIEAGAETLPFDNNYFDLIVSNNGINNVTDSIKVLKESFRVLKNEGQLVFTVNLPDTMIEFYHVFREVLLKQNMNADLLDSHILSKRKSLQMNLSMITGAGYTISDIVTDRFYMRFLDAGAMLNYYFINLAFVESWKGIIPAGREKEIFNLIEEELNKRAEEQGELRLTIPFVCFDCTKG